MNLRHLWAVTRKEFHHILRDRSTLILVLITPTALLLLMAYALTVDIQNVPIAVLDLDRSSLSRSFVQQITAGEDLQLYAQVNTLDEIETLLMHGDIKAALILSPAFASDLLSLRGLPLQIIIDGTEPESGVFAVDHIAWRAEEFINTALADQIQALGFSVETLQPIDLRIRTWFNPSLKPRNDLIPGLISMVLGIPAREALRAIEGVTRQIGEQITIERLGLDPGTFAGFDFSLRVWFNEALSEALYTTPAELGLMFEFTVLLFAALSFSRERELGTLEQLLVMPFSSLEIIIGKAIPVILVGFFDFVLMLTMVHFAFDIPIRGSLPLLLILAFGYLLVELSKGMIISVMSHTQHQAFLLVMLLGMTDFMFTGYAAPVEAMPLAAQRFANLVPAHHWLEILRGILLKGSGLDVIWPHVLALAILGVSIGGFSLRYVRRALD